MSNFLEGLNPEQLEAVKTTEGPLLVLSGAGTGKTRVLTTRIGYIISEYLAKPWEILSLTFTNKAAKEMKQRLIGIIGSQAEQVWMGTFHGIGVRILRAHHDLVNLNPNFLIYNEDDQKSVLKTIMQDMKLDTKKFPPSEAVEIISRLKDKGINYKQFETTLKTIHGVNTDFANGKLSEIYTKYQKQLEQNNAVDYGDLILKTTNLLLTNNEVLRKYQEQFKYILVDEYQDTNTSQYMLLRLLAAKRKNICCVGDDDQSIYSWRGAVIDNILNFEKDYIGAKTIRLEKNYRSTPAILACANSVIKNNSERLGKNLIPNKEKPENDFVIGLSPYSDRDEAQEIADLIEEYHDQGDDYNKFAILIRNASLSRIFEEELVSRKIPYSLIGATRFYDRAEVKDAIAYLRLLIYRDDDVSFKRILNNPKRGMGDVAFGEIYSYAKSRSIPLFQASEELVKNGGLAKRTSESLNNFLNIFKSFDNLEKESKPEEIFYNLLVSAKYIEKWQTSKDIDAKDRLNNLKELVGILKDEGYSLESFLEQISLMTINDETAEKNHVSIMTIHAAKGLEFEIVFLPAWEQGIFPSERTIRDEGDSGLEEERRLAYVAITRARKKLFISATKSRLVYGTRQNNLPSIFWDELDGEFFNTNNKRPIFINKSDTTPRIKNTSSFSRHSSILGAMVDHSEFGRGIVIEEEGLFLTIAFQNYGIKKVAKEYVKIMG